MPPINKATRPIITEVHDGQDVGRGRQKQMQAAAEKVLADFQ